MPSDEHRSVIYSVSTFSFLLLHTPYKIKGRLAQVDIVALLCRDQKLFEIQFPNRWYITTFESMKADFKPELQEQSSSSYLTTKQRNQGEEDLIELSNSGSLRSGRSDKLQTPAWKPSLT